MRLCRFSPRGVARPAEEVLANGYPADADGARLGVVDGHIIRDVTAALDLLPACRYPFPRHDLLIAALPDLRDRIERIAVNAPLLPIEQATLLSMTKRTRAKAAMKISVIRCARPQSVEGRPC